MDRLGGSFDPHDIDENPDYDVAGHDTVEDAPPSPVGQDERRMQVRAYNHWAGLLGDRNFPNIEDLVPEELEDFGPYSVLLDFSMGIEDPAVQHLGARLAEECGGDARTIETLSDVPSRSLLSRITDHYMQILANQAPIGFEAEFVNQQGAAVLYRGILLPYSSDNQTIDFIYGVINWKEMADEQTADALLLEIDQALGGFGDAGDDDGGECPVQTAEMLAAPRAPALVEDDADILDLASVEMVEDDAALSLPLPSFGQIEDEEDDSDMDGFGHTVGPPPTLGIRPDRTVDALGNPIGSGSWTDHDETAFGYYGEDGDEGDHFDSGLKTAADYGLPEWDDEPEADDVEDVVDPLSDETTSTSLTSLVARGIRTKKAVDLNSVGPQPVVPEAYEGPGVTLPAYDASLYAKPADAASPSAEIVDLAAEEPVAVTDHDGVSGIAAVLADQHDDDDESVEDEIAAVDGGDEPEGLFDCLASARELAQAALTTEDRSRKALYAAVGRAYDFSIEAEANPDDYAELIADNGLTAQDRAPMTPIVKLVFGAEYDKTRLTEYAAVLAHAHRVGIERGQLVPYLRSAEGGLKGIVNTERRARKEEQGKPVEDTDGIRSALAKKLRKIDPVDFADLDADGPEFALVMVRRTPAGELVIVGELPEDIPLLEKAARKLVG